MTRPPPKPRPTVAPDSLENRTAWARELGRCDAFDDVLAIWEAGDRDLVPVRARRERELAHAIARARTRTAKSALLGVLALLALAVPIAAFAHSSRATNVEAKVGTISAALVALQHDDIASVTR